MLRLLKSRKCVGKTKGRRGGRYARSSGVTLLEMMIALAIAFIVLAAVLTLSRLTQKAWNTVENDCSANFDLRRAAERIADELRQSTTTMIVVDHSGTDADMVTFMVPISDVAGVISWGADGNAGWSIRYVVENGQLIRRNLTGGMVSAGDQVLATNVDAALAGVKGFSVNVNTGMADIYVRAVVQSNGETWRKTANTSVLFRN